MTKSPVVLNPSPPTHGLAAAVLVVVTAACAPPAPQPPGEFGAEGVGFGHPDHASHVEAIDEIVMAPIREGLMAGASVAVVHGGERIAVRGYGWANLELSVPTPGDAIYETGSITKQFTTAALLQLQEQDLVDLDAEIGTYLPDFPTQGNRITVRELLDHTSGMRGYTEMPAARPYFVRRVPRDSLVALIEAHPFDFPTGEHAIYNNSAYYLAGMILETGLRDDLRGVRGGEDLRRTRDGPLALLQRDRNPRGEGHRLRRGSGRASEQGLRRSQHPLRGGVALRQRG